VRGLQTHKKSEDVALPGSRTAVNISGVNVDQIKRGDIIAHPADFQPTRRIDVQFHLLPGVGHSIKHNTEVKLFIGASEVLARIRLLGIEELVPGESGWLQLESKEKIITVRGDRFILRRPSPGETIGGGVVVDPHPKGRHKLFSTDILARLNALVEGTSSDILFQALLSLGAAPLKDVVVRSQLDNTDVKSALEELLSSGKLVLLESSDTEFADSRINTTELVTSKPYWEQLSSSVIRELDDYHYDYPLRMGMPREELKSRLKISQRIFNVSMNRLVQQGVLQEDGPLVFRPDHTIRYTPQQKLAIDNLIATFNSSPYTPPSVKESRVVVGEDVYDAMVDQGQLVMLSTDVVFSREGYDDMVSGIKQLLLKHETLKAAEVRDHFKTSRKYALALLEHMDAIGITIREGDLRRLKK
jgi:selenocysteine-specific elongation factor